MPTCNISRLGYAPLNPLTCLPRGAQQLASARRV